MALPVALLALLTSACGEPFTGDDDESSHEIALGGEIILFDHGFPLRGVLAYFTEGPYIVDDGEVGLESCRRVREIPYEEPEYLDAGETLQLAGVAQGPLTLYRSAGTYYPESSAGFQWFESYSGNTAYTVNGSGGTEVGGFGATVLAPPNVELLLPSDTGVVKRDEPLTVAWSSTNNGGPVFVSLTQTLFEDDGTGTLDHDEVLCKFADDGIGEIPTRFLENLRLDPGEPIGDQLSTSIQVSKRNLLELEPAGASGVVQVRAQFMDYAPTLSVE